MPEIAAGRSGLRPRQPPRTPLRDLLPGSAGEFFGDPEISGITLDSRLVQPGDLYVALPGSSRHGADFAAAAVAAGAVAILTDPTGADRLHALPAGVPVIVRTDPRHDLGALAARVYGEPARSLLMFGITGTNGKTTTAQLLAAALRGAGLRTGVIGTLGFRVDDESLTGPRTTITTPEAPDLQAVLATMVERGATAGVMEVSSHALVLGRADGIVFDVAAFTNFGRDHLDFHGDLESYFEAKAALFTPQRARRVVLNVDDPRGRQLLDRIGADLPVRTVSLGHDRAGERADYQVSALRTGPDGTQVSVRTPDRGLEFSLALPGEFNVRNAVTALAMADLVGVDVEAAAAGLADAAVPGRMQRVRLDPVGPTVVVDFAHTPQAVASVLRALAGRRRIVVLGSGGDRDPDKREPMGAAAVAEADLVVVTDDNPRTEDPAAIRAAVLRGAAAERRRQPDRAVVEIIDGGDRRRAIGLALRAAGAGDVVAVLGKGHETGQEIAGEILPFDDAEVVRAAWLELSGVAS